MTTEEAFMPKLKVREYLSSDHSAVLHLHKTALLATNAWVASGPWDSDLENIEFTYLTSRGTFLVGVYESKIVAMGALRPRTHSCAEIKRMRVSPKYQRRGFGRYMLRALERHAHAKRFATVRLDTTVKQFAAQHLYTSSGYIEIFRTREGVPFETVFYEKRL